MNCLKRITFVTFLIGVNLAEASLSCRVLVGRFSERLRDAVEETRSEGPRIHPVIHRLSRLAYEDSATGIRFYPANGDLVIELPRCIAGFACTLRTSQALEPAATRLSGEKLKNILSTKAIPTLVLPIQRKIIKQIINTLPHNSSTYKVDKVGLDGIRIQATLDSIIHLRPVSPPLMIPEKVPGPFNITMIINDGVVDTQVSKAGSVNEKQWVEPFLKLVNSDGTLRTSIPEYLENMVHRSLNSRLEIAP